MPRYLDRKSIVPFERGLVFFIRRRTGATKALSGHTSIPVLLEGPYAPHINLTYRSYPTMLAIAGGVGITATLGALRAHPGRRVLYWGCRSEMLVREVQGAGLTREFETHVRVGARWDCAAVLRTVVG